jgi:cellulose synthase/poly-beta-1,6-N-acetylglucosamine synthase-like glycosyltransferase
LITVVGVVVPVADEEAVLGRCLESVCASRAELHHERADLDVRVVAVLDACRDASERVAGAFPGVVTIRTTARRVGIARRAGSAHVLRSTAAPRHSVWLAHTDADSQVPRDWLTGMVCVAELGADLVLGTVRPDVGLPPTALSAWYDAHVLADGHPHVHGANLGVRASAYTALGGWPDVTAGEDHALAARAARAPGLRIVRTSQFPVRTSTRLQARAPYGFSSYLRGLSARRDAESV